MREQSRIENANKAVNITDVVELEIEHALKTYDCEQIIHGHTHRPGKYQNENGISRFVLGAWERCAWIGYSDGYGLDLSCISLDVGQPL